jgi:hypothetical protein
MRASRKRSLSVLLAVAPLIPGAAQACSVSGEDSRFDAVECLQLRADPAAPLTGTVLLNRCEEPVALLVVVCNLALQPACKADPVLSRGWSTRRGVEYVAPAPTSAGSLETSRKAGGARRVEPGASPRAPYVRGLTKGWRAQIAACRLRGESSVWQDPCALRLAELKRSLDASGGKSLRALLKDLSRRCST